MEPRKVANYFTLFTLHMIWLMGRGNISPSVIRFSFCCVCVCFSLGSHTYIFSSKNTVRMPGSSSHLQYSSSQSGFISSNIRGLQVGKIQFLSIRDTFQMSCLLPCLSLSWNGFGCPAKAQWVLGHSKRCCTVASNRKKIDFFLTDGIFWWNVVINFSQCQLQWGFWSFSFVVHVSKQSWRKLLARIQYLQEDILFPGRIWVLTSFCSPDTISKRNN